MKSRVRSARGMVQLEPLADEPGPASDFLTTADVAELLGVSPVTIRRAIASGRIAVARTPGGHARVPRDVAEALARDLGHRP